MCFISCQTSFFFHQRWGRWYLVRRRRKMMMREERILFSSFFFSSSQTLYQLLMWSKNVFDQNRFSSSSSSSFSSSFRLFVYFNFTSKNREDKLSLLDYYKHLSCYLIFFILERVLLIAANFVWTIFAAILSPVLNCLFSIKI